MDDGTKAKEIKYSAHVFTFGVCQRKDLSVGSTCQCSLHYPTYMKYARMNVYIYEYLTKNSMGAAGLLGGKEGEMRESGKDRKRKGKYSGTLSSLFPPEISDMHRGKSDTFIPFLKPQRSLSCHAVDKRSGFSLEPGVADLLLPAPQN